jgi:hypothetical protein
MEEKNCWTCFYQNKNSPTTLLGVCTCPSKNNPTLAKEIPPEWVDRGCKNWKQK